MSERRGTKGLELWCRRVTEGYPGVDVKNMTTSWRDGLAFCAIIHRFRPDLIDFSSLRSDDARHNNELAFRVAERHLGVPALLDAEDMVDSTTPDRLSVLTYLAQFYQAFSQEALTKGITSSRRSVLSKEFPAEIVEKPRKSPDEPISKKVWQLPREPCAMCGLPVFLAERLTCFGRTFHRTCFKCARCGAQLNPANCYETESCSFCCEVCPDEVLVLPESSSDNDSASVSGSCDDYSTNFETVLDDEPGTPPLDNPALTSFLCSQLEPQSGDITLTNNLLLNDNMTTSLHDSVTKNDFGLLREALRSSLTISDCDNNTKPSNGQPNQSMSSELNKPLSNRSSLVSSRKTLFENIIQNEEKPVPLRKSSLTIPNLLPLVQGERDKPSQQTVTSSDINEGVLGPEGELNTSVSLEDMSHKNVPEAADISTNVASHEGTPELDTSSSTANETSHESAPELDGSSLAANDDESREGDPQLNTSDSKELSRESTPDMDFDSKNVDETTHDNSSEMKTAEQKRIVPVPAARQGLTKTQTLDEIPSPKERKAAINLKAIPVTENFEEYPDDLNPFAEEEEKKVSTNPFGSSDEEDEMSPVPVARRVVPADAYLNPFWEPTDQEEDEKRIVPVPRPRSYRSSSPNCPSPVPRRSTPGSTTVSPTKKKQVAPPPPSSSANVSPAITPTGSLRPARKNRPAPRPPLPTSKVPELNTKQQVGDKIIKDELNRTRQLAAERVAPEKSHQGQWKRKKGPAPALPIPPKRQVRTSMPPGQLQQELELIEVQQRGLEKQGVRLEEQIREQLAQLGCDSDEAHLPAELEENVLQLFELVNEKNELFRHQAELMYLKRQQRLEEQQADVEWQIRCLLQNPHRKEEDLKREEELIARLVAVVEQRNQIVDCLEMDRKREVDEDQSVRERLQMLSPDRHQQQKPEETVGPKSTKKKTKIRLIPKSKSKSKEKNNTLENHKNKESATHSQKSINVPDSTKESPSNKKHTKKKWFS